MSQNFIYLVGLGSSIDPKIDHLRTALQEMRQIFKLICVSDFIFTDPVGGVAMNTFVNSVALIESEGTAVTVLDQLLTIETKMGRKRLKKWADRSIDLDLLFGWLNFLPINSTDPYCIVPHPFFSEREFNQSLTREILNSARLLGINLNI